MKIRDNDIIEEKIRWIERLYLSLLLIVKAGGQYKEGSIEGEKYLAYVTRLSHGSLSDFKEIIECLCGPDASEMPAMAKKVRATDFASDVDPQFLENLKRLSSPRYEAPIELDGMLHDLEFLWAYWASCHPSKPCSTNSRGVSEDGLDMALVKLSKNIGGWQISAMVYGTYNLSRTLKSTRGHRERMKKDAQPVKDMLFKLNVPPKTKLHRVAKMIQDELSPKPSLDTIKTILRYDPETKQFFRREGRFWIYESVTPS